MIGHLLFIYLTLTNIFILLYFFKVREGTSNALLPISMEITVLSLQFHNLRLI